MSVSGAAVPVHLRGNPGACLAICTKALRFNFDPFSLAEHSFSMKKYVDVTVENANGDDVEGIEITAGLVSAQSSSNRAARLYAGLSATIQLAGGIRTVNPLTIVLEV